MSGTFNIRYLLFLLTKCPTDIHGIKAQINLSSPEAVPSAQPGQSRYLFLPSATTEILTLEEKQASSGCEDQQQK